MNEDYEFIVLKLKEISRETNENVRNEELKKLKRFFSVQILQVKRETQNLNQ